MPIIFANILQPLIDAGEGVMVFFHDTIGFGWGLSIIALTISVRLLILPLTLKQFSSMREMQRIQPEMKALQAKYKEDRQRLNQEMMKLYQEHGVNPLGSCLPLVLQLPVFFSLFYMLRHDLRHDICGQTAKVCGEIAGSHDQSFLFVKDLTDNATGGALVTLMVLYIGSQLVSSLLMTVTADKTQRYLMLGLPFIFSYVILSFPAGLIVYWITTNTWTIGQQYLVRRRFGPAPSPVAAAEAAAEHALGLDHDDKDDGAKGTKAPKGAAGAKPSSSNGGKSGDAPAQGGLGGLLDRVRSGGQGSTATAPPPQRTTSPPPPPRKKKRKRSGKRR
jgi:YidC/Oxa1 family membrane protein insertase